MHEGYLVRDLAWTPTLLFLTHQQIVTVEFLRCTFCQHRRRQPMVTPTLVVMLGPKSLRNRVIHPSQGEITAANKTVCTTCAGTPLRRS